MFFFGKILRRHGLKGYWIVHTKCIKITESFNKPFLFIDIDALKVPFFVQDYKIFSNDHLLIQFFGDNIQKEDLAHHYLYLSLERESSFVIEKSSDDLTLIGFNVQDIHKGHVGILIGINEQSSQKLLELRFQDVQIWVPMVKEFIVEINYKKRFILLNCPKGLLDLYI